MVFSCLLFVFYSHTVSLIPCHCFTCYFATQCHVGVVGLMMAMIEEHSTSDPGPHRLSCSKESSSSDPDIIRERPNQPTAGQSFGTLETKRPPPSPPRGVTGQITFSLPLPLGLSQKDSTRYGGKKKYP